MLKRTSQEIPRERERPKQNRKIKSDQLCSLLLFVYIFCFVFINCNRLYNNNSIISMYCFGFTVWLTESIACPRITSTKSTNQQKPVQSKITLQIPARKNMMSLNYFLFYFFFFCFESLS